MIMESTLASLTQGSYAAYNLASLPAHGDASLGADRKEVASFLLPAFAQTLSVLTLISAETLTQTPCLPGSANK